MGDLRRLTMDRMMLAAEQANEQIANCHEVVACPTCGSAIGERCHPLRSRMGSMQPVKTQTTKHPHHRRWTQVVAPR